MIHIWRPLKLSNFQGPHPSFHQRPKFFHPLDFRRPISNNPASSNDNLSVRRKHNPRMTIMLPGPSFRSTFVFSINSLILSGFPLTSFHLAEASLSAFSWLYTLVSSIVQKYHEMLQLFTFLVLILQSTCFICTTWKRKQTMEQQPHRACERTKSKQKQNQVTSHSNWPRVLLFDLAHKQCNGIIKGWFHCHTSEWKGTFLVIIYCLAQHDVLSWRKSNFL